MSSNPTQLGNFNSRLQLENYDFDPTNRIYRDFYVRPCPYAQVPPPQERPRSQSPMLEYPCIGDLPLTPQCLVSPPPTPQPLFPKSEHQPIFHPEHIFYPKPEPIYSEQHTPQPPYQLQYICSDQSGTINSSVDIEGEYYSCEEFDLIEQGQVEEVDLEEMEPVGIAAVMGRGQAVQATRAFYEHERMQNGVPEHGPGQLPVSRAVASLIGPMNSQSIADEPTAPKPASSKSILGNGRGIKRHEPDSAPATVGMGRGQGFGKPYVHEENANGLDDQTVSKKRQSGDVPPRRCRVQGGSSYASNIGRSGDNPRIGSSKFGRPPEGTSPSSSKTSEPPTSWRIGMAQPENNRRRDRQDRTELSDEEFRMKWEDMYNKATKVAYAHKFVDTHAHLDWLYEKHGQSQHSGFATKYHNFKDRNKETWSPALEFTIADWCRPDIIEDDSDGFLEALKDTTLYHAVGVHPHFADKFDDIKEKVLRRLAEERVIAVGEMGLDYSKANNVDHDIQKRVFREQLQWAIDMKKPALLHVREAEQDALDICKEVLPRYYKIHRHCFTLGMVYAQEWLDAFPNLKLGLTPLIVDPGYRDQVLETAEHCPLDRLLIETDAPFFAPPFYTQVFARLKGGHPAMGICVALKLAELKRVNVDTVLQQIRQNTTQVYGI